MERGADAGKKLAKGAAKSAAAGSEEAFQLGGVAKQVGVLGKGFKVAGVFGTLITTGIATGEVYSQYKEGGAKNVFHHRAILDAGVGVVGLGGIALTTLGIISNPVGWGIGIGVLVYGAGTMIYVATH